MLFIIRWILSKFYPNHELTHVNRTFRTPSPAEYDAMVEARKGVVRSGTADEREGIEKDGLSDANSHIKGGISRISQGVTDRGYVNGEPSWKRTT